jgi:hypothetical protein
MKLLAGLEVTTKAVERTAETIGEDIAAREQEQIQRAVQLDLPMVLGDPIPFLYVEMDGTGVPVVKNGCSPLPGRRSQGLSSCWYRGFSPRRQGAARDYTSLQVG